MGGRPVTGMPYSAQQKTEHVQLLADGTRIAQTLQRTTLYRDSQGRTRVEHILTRNPQAPGAAASAEVDLIEIFDAATGARYNLQPRNHTAQQLPEPRQFFDSAPPAPPLPPPNMVRARDVVTSPPARQAMPRPQFSSESLGSRTIEGIIASGQRTTTVYPIGFFGNDRPFSTTSEIWTSPELNMAVLSINSDPRSGDTTTSLTNISRAEPDPSMFQVPPDYQIATPK